jgi:hypothetical protein
MGPHFIRDEDYPSASPQLIRMYNNRRPLSAAAADRSIAKVREAMTRAPWTVASTRGNNIIDMASWNPERYRK